LSTVIIYVWEKLIVFGIVSSGTHFVIFEYQVLSIKYYNIVFYICVSGSYYLKMKDNNNRKIHRKTMLL